MDQRYATSPEHVPGMDTAELRRRYLVQDLFVAERGQRRLHPPRPDRARRASAPSTGRSSCGTFPEIRTDHFFEHREAGIVNVGGTGTVSVDGTELRR